MEWESVSMMVLDSARARQREGKRGKKCDTLQVCETLWEIVTFCTFDEHAVDDSNGHFSVAIQT
jgi:hypothetical protein